MRSLLFLSVVMEQGWGVSLEIGEIVRRLRSSGIDVHVGADRVDSSFDWLGVHKVSPTVEGVREIARRLRVSVIAAHTSPYFEVLPALTGEFETWAWENGDPTPSFFERDSRQRQLVKEYKRDNVYPKVNRTVAISEFIKHDIAWPFAEVVHLAANHMPDRGPKSVEDVGVHPIRVGTLMRLGKGEAQYKGNHHFLTLVEEIKRLGLPVEAHVAGRGTEDDAAAFRDRGIVPHLNLSEEAKAEYLRSLDIFISMSLWEGFNLPVAEAQALGTLSFALDVGAHPEVCPYLLATPHDAVRYVQRAVESREWLVEASGVCYRFMRGRFSWERTAEEVSKLLGSPCRNLPPALETPFRRRIRNAALPIARRLYRGVKDIYRRSRLKIVPQS